MTSAGEGAPGTGSSRPVEAEFRGKTATAAVQWNFIAVLGRQGFQLVTALVIARVIGPESYGIISAASIYITFTSLLLDQGLAAALIQRPKLSSKAPGAAATLNIFSGILLAIATWWAAPWVAEFFSVDQLTEVLRWLGLGLVVKSLSIAPRAMFSRTLSFRSIAIAEVAGAGAGCLLGIGAALLGVGAQSVVFQILTMDSVVAAVLLVSWRGPVPNLRVAEVRVLLPFGLRVMATNGIAYFARNVDNILVGRVLGLVALSYYAMAYRVLVLPVQMIGQTVSRVMFPAFSRLADKRELLAENLLSATAMLAMVTLPLMALVASAAPQIVQVVLGDQWMPAAPILTILAIAGARETVVYLTGPLMKATGEVKLAIRYELLATLVQVAGIVLGLQFGILGVAVGYTLAGFALLPVLLTIQRRLTGATLPAQLGAWWPPLHASGWASAAYLLVTTAGLGPLATLVLGALAFAVVAGAVLLLVHRAATRHAVDVGRRLMRRPGSTRGGRLAAAGP